MDQKRIVDYLICYLKDLMVIPPTAIERERERDSCDVHVGQQKH